MKRRTERLLHAFVYERAITQQQYDPENQRLTKREAEIEQSLAALAEQEGFAEDAVAFGLNLLANASAEWSKGV